jgi:hypothetical protein
MDSYMTSITNSASWRETGNEHGPLGIHSQTGRRTEQCRTSFLGYERRLRAVGRPEPISRPVITTVNPANSTNSVNPSTPVMSMDQAVPLPESKALPAPAPDQDHQDPAVSGAATFRLSSLPVDTVNPADLVNLAPTISPPPAPDQDYQDPVVLGAAIFRPNSQPSKNSFNGHPLVRVSDHFSQSIYVQQSRSMRTIIKKNHKHAIEIWIRYVTALLMSSMLKIHFSAQSLLVDRLN